MNLKPVTSAGLFKGQTKEEEVQRGSCSGPVSAISTMVAWWIMGPAPEHLMEAERHQAFTPK